LPSSDYSNPQPVTETKKNPFGVIKNKMCCGNNTLKSIYFVWPQNRKILELKIIVKICHSY